MRRTWLPWLGLLAAACSNGGGSAVSLGASLQADEARLRAMYEEIFDLVADRSCTDSAQCASAPVGAKPCGGPTLHVLYSRPNVDEAVLQAKLEALYEFEQAVNERYGRGSDCSVPPAPKPGCKEELCVDTSS